MNRVAIAFSTKDRVELTRQSIGPLLQPDKFDLHWFDGSDTQPGELLPAGYSQVAGLHANVRGGACRAFVYALTAMLAHPNNYTHIGYTENDQLLDPDWFDAAMALFVRGEQDGLRVGAVSARCYEDRILIQRDGYAVMNNLGWGNLIMTRQAAEFALHSFRTHWTTENRRIFLQLSGVDISPYWAFRAGEHMLVADWGYDRMLAAQLGLASLACMPSRCRSLDPEFGNHNLVHAAGPVEARRDDVAFDRYAENLHAISDRTLRSPDNLLLRDDQGVTTFFPHQVFYLEGADYRGNWMLKWSQGFGPFSWRVGTDDEFPFYHTPSGSTVPERQPCSFTCWVSGPCNVLVTGPGQVLLEDLHSGYSVKPTLPTDNQQLMTLVCPSGVSYRQIRLTALTPGVVFYGLQTREAQPLDLTYRFDDTKLPPL